MPYPLKYGTYVYTYSNDANVSDATAAEYNEYLLGFFETHKELLHLRVEYEDVPVGEWDYTEDNHFARGAPPFSEEQERACCAVATNELAQLLLLEAKADAAMLKDALGRALGAAANWLWHHAPRIVYEELLLHGGVLDSVAFLRMLGVAFRYRPSALVPLFRSTPESRLYTQESLAYKSALDSIVAAIDVLHGRVVADDARRGSSDAQNELHALALIRSQLDDSVHKKPSAPEKKSSLPMKPSVPWPPHAAPRYIQTRVSASLAPGKDRKKDAEIAGKIAKLRKFLAQSKVIENIEGAATADAGAEAAAAGKRFLVARYAVAWHRNAALGTERVDAELRSAFAGVCATILDGRRALTE